MNKKITLIVDDYVIIDAAPLRGEWNIEHDIACPGCFKPMEVAMIDLIQYGLQWDLHTNFLRCVLCKKTYYIRYEVMLTEDENE